MKIRYAALKNLSRLLPDVDANKAINLMIEATEIDSTECLLWWRLGNKAKKIGNCILARDSYQEIIT